jgi:hypothetical protein
MKGKILTKHRNLPTEEQDEAMSEYVDSMNLMTFQHDEEGHLHLLTFADLEILKSIFVLRILTLPFSIE